MSEVAADEDKMAGFLDREAIKLMYKPVGIVAGVAGGLLASRAFARIWRALSGKDAVPDPTDEAQSWAAILPAAALHGIVFGVVKALVDRASAKAFERMTGAWPWPRKRSKAAPTPNPERDQADGRAADSRTDRPTSAAHTVRCTRG